MSNSPSLSILIAEDDDTDVLLLRRAFREAGVDNPLHVTRDGQEAIDFLTQAKNHAEGRLPALLLLDLKMPRRSGIQVLDWVRQQPAIRNVPVMIFSSSENRNDIENAYSAGANGYLIKPPSLSERADVARFIKEWLRLNQPPAASVESVRAAQSHRSNPPLAPAL